MPEAPHLPSRRDHVAWCYEHLGWSFVPLEGKRPTQPNWPHRPRESREEALAWADAGNIGVRTGQASGGLVVIDVDPGGDTSHLNLPPTTTAITGRDGRHYFFQAARPIRNSAGRLGEHVDVRGDGGQVVFVGSIHPVTEEPYTWLADHEPWVLRPAALPESVLTRLDPPHPRRDLPGRPSGRSGRENPDRRHRYASFVFRAEVQAVLTAAEGSRNDTLNRAAFGLGRLVGGGYLDRDEVERELQLAARRAGLAEPEAGGTIQSGLRAGMQQPRQLPAQPAGVAITTPEGQVEVPSLPPGRFRLNAAGNGDRFQCLFGDDVRWCEASGKWFVWDGACWQPDDVLEVPRWAELTVLALLAEAEASREEATLKWAVRCNKTTQAQKEILQITKHRTAVPPAAWDQHDWLLGVQNGVVDLRTGELMPHDRSHLMTRLCSTVYQPDALCPRWLRFLEEIMPGNPEMITALQRLAGYFLTGDVSVQVLPIFFGSGANGKSVFLDALVGLLGPYAGKAADSLITATTFDQHPTEIADLMGKRLVVASETEEGKRMRVALVKQLTGDATLKGRFMRQDFFEFKRCHKTILVTNHKPVVTESSHAVWRRLRLIPFEVTIPPERQDRQLLHTLRAEWPGILAWAVQGCLDWQCHGGDLALPEKVQAATDAYRGESNPLDQFLQERCMVGPTFRVPRADLYRVYEQWADGIGEEVPSARTLADRMRANGFTETWMGVSGRTSRVRGWQGLMLAPPDAPPGNSD